MAGNVMNHVEGLGAARAVSESIDHADLLVWVDEISLAEAGRYAGMWNIKKVSDASLRNNKAFNSEAVNLDIDRLVFGCHLTAGRELAGTNDKILFRGAIMVESLNSSRHYVCWFSFYVRWRRLGPVGEG